ncbi:hypothetical protein, partial [Holdemanella biformis]|uniref:hypothetical protein n=1 Tax=Holdemanella biformis TaxID=1735 RepID=UPI0026DF472B
SYTPIRRSVLAKIHMVTKLYNLSSAIWTSSVLAKIHMVTKQYIPSCKSVLSSVLAKIHMVTKPQKYGSTFLNVIEY